MTECAIGNGGSDSLAFLRSRHGGSPTSLLLGLVGLGLVFIWLVETFRWKPEKYGLF
jgi:hypothetical protein